MKRTSWGGEEGDTEDQGSQLRRGGILHAICI